jgi:anti-sigma factor RsiW
LPIRPTNSALGFDMSKPQPHNENEATDLVAYLDGELEGPAAQAVEKRLARDRSVRAEAAALKQAWDLLDLLPQPEPSPSFTHRTLERLAPLRTMSVRSAPPRTLAAPSAPPRTMIVASAPLRARWRRRVFGGLAWAAALVVAFLGGYGVFNRLRPAEPGKAELLRDFQVLENKRLYEHVENVDEAEELRQIFNDDHQGS